MNFDLRRPCTDCPFLKEGGIRLRTERAKDIADMMLSRDGGSFACHKTTEAGGSDGPVKHCAGALIFAEKHQVATQIMRIAERVNMYDHTKLVDQDRVFDTRAEMLEEQEG
jgi:hypothetical protein